MPRDADISDLIAAEPAVEPSVEPAAEPAPAEPAPAPAETAPATPPAAEPVPAPAAPEPSSAEVLETLRKKAADRQAAKAREERAKAERAAEEEYRRKAAELDETLRLFKEDPIGAFEKFGLSMAELADKYARGERPKPDPVAPVRSEVERVRQELQQLREEQARERAAYQRAQAEQWFVHAATKEHSERFPFINALLEPDEIVPRLVEVKRQVDAAGAEVDDLQLLAILEHKLSSRRDKLSAIFSKPQAAPAGKPDTPAPASIGREPPGPKTLTHELTGVAATPRRKLSREERIREAEAVLQEELRKEKQKQAG